MQNFLHFTTTNLYSIIIILQLHQLLFFPIYFEMSSPIFHMTPEIAPLFLKGMGGPKQDPKGLLRLHLKFKSAAKGKPVLWSAESLAKTYGESHSTFLMKYSKFPIQCSIRGGHITFLVSSTPSCLPACACFTYQPDP